MKKLCKKYGHNFRAHKLRNGAEAVPFSCRRRCRAMNPRFQQRTETITTSFKSP